MVDRRYLLEQPGRPSRLTTLVNRQLIPAAIDLAAHLEAALQGLAVAVKARPTTCLALAFTTALLAGRRGGRAPRR